MPLTFIETQNKAAVDYPYLLLNKENLICRSHFHRDLELVEVVHGEVLVIRDGQKLLLKEGELCAVMPEEIHSYQSPSFSCVHVIKIACRHSVEGADLSALRLPCAISLSSPTGQRLRGALEGIRREHEARQLGYGFAVNAYCAQILRELVRSELCITRAREEQKKHVTSMSALNAVYEYVRAHYTEPIALCDIASACGFSVYYFSHLFKDATGTTFINYLTAYRSGGA